ncbi:Response regulator receiver domain-containing protein [Paracoccus isoporae]|uniref:Response regulator receiver domain-containing protein n=1 Tax=Paracoccus isoporae TaxID=591205 RepID=A0A1G6SU32_9RHOB|nr:response regulator [Paracoccus isoporae]SDD20134.1 Response regulator receiver domain-containing protein [Paracoccus isoporae]
MLTERVTTDVPLPLWSAPLPGRPLSGLTVLVVEDSLYASEAIRLLCLRSGARIRRADCLGAAMRHLRTYRPCVVIVDMGLPDGSGADLIRKIRSLQTQAPTVLAISGDPAERDHALAAGAEGFLEKPIDNLAVFQQAILSTLPSEVAPSGPRLLPDDRVTPNHAALRDDLRHVAEVLATAGDGSAVGYIAKFLAGVARSAHDPVLAEAAEALSRDHAAGRALATDLTRISALVHQRLSRLSQG